ncbi:MAG: ATP-binding protein [Oligoflexales bacterium]
MKFNKINSLQIKFIIVTVGLISLINITGSYFSYKNLKGELEKSIDEKAYQLISLLAKIGTVPLGEFDIPTLESFIEEARLDPNIIDAVYFDSDNEAVTSLTDLNQFKEKEIRIYKQDIFSESRDNVRIGYIKLIYSLKPLNNKLDAKFVNSVKNTVFLVLTTAILLNLLFITLVNRRIKKLLSTVTAIGNNDFTVRTNEMSHDEIGRLGRQVDSTAENLEKIIKQLNDKKDMIEYFIRILSHDICNSLTIASGQIVRIRRKKITLEYGLERMEKSLNQAFKIVETVRYWMAHKDNKLMLKEENIKFSEILEHIDFTFKDRLEEKQIRIKYLNDLPENICIEGDRNAIFFQIINNIISNAIKYSSNSSEIHISTGLVDQNIKVVISDFGTGINPNIIEHIFSPHHATSQNGTLNEAGTGFGMPIAKALMEKMSGDIQVSNRLEASVIKGADVILLFPVRPSTRQAKKIAS